MLTHLRRMRRGARNNDYRIYPVKSSLSMYVTLTNSNKMLTRSNQALKVLISLTLSIYNQLCFKTFVQKLFSSRSIYDDVFVDKVNSVGALSRSANHFSLFLHGSKENVWYGNFHHQVCWCFMSLCCNLENLILFPVN